MLKKIIYFLFLATLLSAHSQGSEPKEYFDVSFSIANSSISGKNREHNSTALINHPASIQYKYNENSDELASIGYIVKDLDKAGVITALVSLKLKTPENKDIVDKTHEIKLKSGQEKKISIIHEDSIIITTLTITHVTPEEIIQRFGETPPQPKQCNENRLLSDDPSITPLSDCCTVPPCVEVESSCCGVIICCFPASDGHSECCCSPR